MADIAAGSTVNIKIVKTPSSESARKTLVRLLSKDDEVRTENRRLERVRAKNISYHQRGGRPWAVRPPKQRPVKGEVGESGTILASPDVLRDLKGVERFVDVSAA